MKQIITDINNLLKDIDIFTDGQIFSEDRSVRADTDILVIYNDPYFDEERVNKYCYLISVFQIKEVIENLNQQLIKPNTQDYVDAINFYIENDAFIDLEEENI